ncbi:MAG: sensor histidine kinase [Gelidibacter sp.]
MMPKSSVPYCFLLFFMVQGIAAYGQHKKGSFDSQEKRQLNQRLQNALNQLEFDKALLIADSIEKYGMAKDDLLFTTFGYSAKSEIYSFRGNVPKAKEYLKKSLPIFKKLNMYSRWTDQQSAYANLLRKEGKLDSSFIVLNTIHPFVSDTLEKRSLTYFYNIKEASFLMSGQIDSTIHYIYKRIDLIENGNNYEIGNAYLQLAAVFYKVSDNDKALSYINKALDQIKGSEDNYRILACKNYIAKANILISLNRHEEAEIAAKNALGLLNEKSAIDYEIQAKLSLAKIYWETNRKDQAKKVFNVLDHEQKGISNQTLYDVLLMKLKQAADEKDWNHTNAIIARLTALYPEISNLSSKKEFFRLLADVWKDQNELQKSIEAQHEFQELNEQINTLQRTYMVYDLEKKYQVEKKDKEILAQQLALQKSRDQNIFGIIAIVILLLSTLGLFIFFRQGQKLKNIEISKLKQQQDLTKLKALIEGEERERNRLAQELHDGINGDLSSIKYQLYSLSADELSSTSKSIFEKAVAQIDHSCQQVRNISHNLSPLTIRDFGLMTSIKNYCSKLESIHPIHINFQHFGTDVSLPKNIETVIYRIVQELVNNIIKHAQATEALVQINTHEETMFITVEDNGKGFQNNPNNAGIGLKNIASRIAFLNAQLEEEHTANGTTFTININLNTIPTK